MSAERAAAVPRPSHVLRPPEIARADEARGVDAFFLRGGLVDAWFERRSDVLAVSFDNLSSVGEYDPPRPWLYGRAARAGVSILGLIAARKDWYRNADVVPLIEGLRAAGVFDGFRRVICLGASMGGFAALAHAPLIPGAAVLAFSPQSTLARGLVPFETRYRYAMRKWDWETPACLDAAGAVDGREVTLVYDPLEAEDRAHAARLDGPGVTHLRVPMMGHKAIRSLKALGVLDGLIEGALAGEIDAGAFWRGFRARRGDVGWQRALAARAVARGHVALLRRGLAAMERSHPETGFARREAKRLADRGAAQGDVLRHVGAPPPPFTGAIHELSGALVLPERAGSTDHACGVLHADGRFCAESRAWVRSRSPTPEPVPTPGEPVVDLPGRHLFGGPFRAHFGHFLLESTARLWALDHVGGRVDSLLYLPYRGEVKAIERVIEGYRPIFRTLGLEMPIRTVATALRVERLIVPELGFGWNARYAGSPAYRAFMQGRLRAAAAPEGGADLYISRARLGGQRGGVLGEAFIEAAMAQAGYEVFHPEKHPLEEQIARYRAARRIVALDGSALHLVAFVAEPGTRVAMILRRSRANVGDYLMQFRSFCGNTPAVIDVIRHDWIGEGSNRADFRSVGEVDFAGLAEALVAQGFLPGGLRFDWPDAAGLAALLAQFQDRRGGAMRKLRPGETHRDAEEEDAG